MLKVKAGWGSFIIIAISQIRCCVTSLILNKKQKELAEQYIAEIGLSNKINIFLCDYYALPQLTEGYY